MTVEIPYDPDTDENIIKRARTLKDELERLKKLSEKPKQEELRNIVFEPFDLSEAHLDLDKMFEDY